MVNLPASWLPRNTHMAKRLTTMRYSEKWTIDRPSLSRGSCTRPVVIVVHFSMTSSPRLGQLDEDVNGPSLEYLCLARRRS